MRDSAKTAALATAAQSRGTREQGGNPGAPLDLHNKLGPRMTTHRIAAYMAMQAPSVVVT